MNSKTGTLFVVATPIGNLIDISPRAIESLSVASLILAEDTRHARKLLSHYGGETPVQACHEHNEQGLVPRVMATLEQGEDIALVSDAGTPLISDPGYRVVQAARELGMAVSPIPGPSALVAALSVSGLPTDRFLFAGFLPPKSTKRLSRLEELRSHGCTVVLYESSHRIVDALSDIRAVFGDQAQICVGREITKKFETFYSGTAAEVSETISTGADNQKGEFVVVLGAVVSGGQDLQKARDLARLLAAELPPKRAAKIAAETFGVSRNDCYQAIIDK